ncbi:MAG: lipoprotein-releasing system ATP-binding protein [Candidatus Dependentiae bacterium]|nr:lipoprotein-releasing system ATP-binding protein [Candidatus Dependentiae bacterium]
MSFFFDIQNLSFGFTDNQSKLFFVNVSCAFKKNTMNFIRGKNGAGKSTLFRILRGTVDHTEFITGTIVLNQQSFDLSNGDQRRKLAHSVRLAPQKFDEMLADQFTFPQNLQLAALPHYPGLDRFVPAATVPKLVDRFGIDYAVPAGMLSGGQRQILAILMALQKPASILLLDEPTAALDDKNAAMVMTFLNDLLKDNPELTILIICHDKELVEQYAQKHYHKIEVNDDDTRTIHPIATLKESTL